MNNFLQDMKEKVVEKFKTITTELRPQDDHDKALHALVEKGTSEALIGPDWNVNMQFVDYININAAVFSDKALRALRTTLVRHNAKVQILGLTILETCVKNCQPGFHVALASSDLWGEMLKIASDTSIGRADAEVRDKVLAMVEDYARGLGPHQFKEAYDGLMEKGIDFPVRSPEDQMPQYVPPMPVSVAPSGGAGGGGGSGGSLPVGQLNQGSAATTAAATAAWAAQAGAGGANRPDPFQGMTPEDRAAVAAAMAEMEAEERAVQASAFAAAAAAAAPTGHLAQSPSASVHAGVPLTPAASPAQPLLPAVATHGHQPLTALLPAAQQGGSPMAGGAGPDDSAEGFAAKLLVMKNSAELLSEMLSTVPEEQPSAVLEPFIAELAAECTRMKQRLESSMGSLQEEERLMAAFAQHEELEQVLGRHSTLVSLARPQQALVAAPPPAAVVAPPAAVAVGASRPPTFVIADEEEGALVTRRTAGDGPPSPATIPSPHSLPGHSQHHFTPPPPVPEEGPEEPCNADEPSLAASSSSASYVPPPPSHSHHHSSHSHSMEAAALVAADPFMNLLGDDVPLVPHLEESVKQYDDHYGGHYEAPTVPLGAPAEAAHAAAAYDVFVPAPAAEVEEEDGDEADVPMMEDVPAEAAAAPPPSPPAAAAPAASHPQEAAAAAEEEEKEVAAPPAAAAAAPAEALDALFDGLSVSTDGPAVVAPGAAYHAPHPVAAAEEVDPLVASLDHILAADSGNSTPLA